MLTLHPYPFLFESKDVQLLTSLQTKYVQTKARASHANESATAPAMKGLILTQAIFLRHSEGKAKGNLLFCQSSTGIISTVVFIYCEALQGIPYSYIRNTEFFPFI